MHVLCQNHYAHAYKVEVDRRIPLKPVRGFHRVYLLLLLGFAFALPSTPTIHAISAQVPLFEPYLQPNDVQCALLVLAGVQWQTTSPSSSFHCIACPTYFTAALNHARLLRNSQQSHERQPIRNHPVS